VVDRVEQSTQAVESVRRSGKCSCNAPLEVCDEHRADHARTIARSSMAHCDERQPPSAAQSHSADEAQSYRANSIAPRGWIARRLGVECAHCVCMGRC